jgi:hypothetical protein
MGLQQASASWEIGDGGRGRKKKRKKKKRLMYDGPTRRERERDKRAARDEDGTRVQKYIYNVRGRQ